MPTVTYRAHRSRRAFVNAPAVRRELEATIDGPVKDLVLEAFRKRTANWKSDVDFAARKFIRVEGIRIIVYATGRDKKIWHYVSRGTPRHDIPVKNAPWLIFLWGGPGSYVPKTTPSGGYGGPGVVTGGSIQKRKRVDHPGFPGREFEEKIRAEVQPKARYIIELAFRRGIRAMNRGA